MAAKSRSFELPDGTRVQVRNETDAVNVRARGGREVKAASAQKPSAPKTDSK
jgi:hypothetical protein